MTTEPHLNEYVTTSQITTHFIQSQLRQTFIKNLLILLKEIDERLVLYIS